VVSISVPVLDHDSRGERTWFIDRESETHRWPISKKCRW
jgi:hypothetical protein